MKATTERQKMIRIAGSLNARLTLQRSFAEWKEAVAQRKLEQRKAAVVNNFFVQRSTLKTWAKKMRWAKANAAVLAKEKEIRRDYLQSKSWTHLSICPKRDESMRGTDTRSELYSLVREDREISALCYSRGGYHSRH